MQIRAKVPSSSKTGGGEISRRYIKYKIAVVMTMLWGVIPGVVRVVVVELLEGGVQWAQYYTVVWCGRFFLMSRHSELREAWFLHSSKTDTSVRL